MSEVPHCLERDAAPLVDAACTAHLPAEPGARVVSLVPSLTELLLALGVGEQVVGRTRYCIHPSSAVAGIPVVGGTKGVRMERVRALAPTHVVVNMDENTREDVEALREFIPHVIVTHPGGPADNPGLYRLLGGVFGRGEAAERLCAAFDDAFRAVLTAGRGLPPRRVLYLIWRRPWMTVSPDTYIGRMLETVNWHNVTSGEGIRYPQVGLDRSLLDSVDAVLLSSEPYPFRPRHLNEVRALASPGGARVLRIDGEMTSWYGNRAIPGLNYLAGLARHFGETAA